MRRCNHCDGPLGLVLQRKGLLRFCSKRCKKAYEQKLEEERRAKLRHLAFLAPRSTDELSGWAAGITSIASHVLPRRR
jgi:hypothetical protein